MQSLDEHITCRSMLMCGDAAEWDVQAQMPQAPTHINDIPLRYVNLGIISSYLRTMPCTTTTMWHYHTPLWLTPTVLDMTAIRLGIINTMVDANTSMLDVSTPAVLGTTPTMQGTTPTMLGTTTITIPCTTLTMLGTVCKCILMLFWPLDDASRGIPGGSPPPDAAASTLSTLWPGLIWHPLLSAHPIPTVLHRARPTRFLVPAPNAHPT